MKKIEPWLLHDSGGNRFSLKSYDITINENKSKVAQLFNNPKLPTDIDKISSIYHEIYHWLCNCCSSFGVFLNFLSSMKNGTALILLTILQETTKIKKPAINQLSDLFSDSNKQDIVDIHLEAYLSIKKLIDILIGVENCTISKYQDLFKKCIYCFSYARLGLTMNEKEILAQLNIQNIRKIYNDFVSNSFCLDDNDDQEVKLFVDFLRTIDDSIFAQISNSLFVNPEVRFYEFLSWSTLLEGSAKYFQELYRLNLWALTNNSKIKPIEDRTSWESWDSVYVRPLRTMMEIMYGDERLYTYEDLTTFLALVDLSINPALNMDWLLPDKINALPQDFLPGYRFLKSCRVAKDVGPLRFDNPDILDENIEGTYKTYIGNLCAKLGWEPPWIQAIQWLQKYEQCPEFFEIYPFFAGCKLRKEYPLFFGLPHLVVDSKDGKTWNHFLNQIPIPAFAAKDSAPIIGLSKDHDHRSIIRQRIFLQLAVILDQVMVEDGQIDWTPIISVWKDFGLEMRDILINVCRNHGVDIENIE